MAPTGARRVSCKGGLVSRHTVGPSQEEAFGPCGVCPLTDRSRDAGPLRAGHGLSQHARPSPRLRAPCLRRSGRTRLPQGVPQRPVSPQGTSKLLAKGRRCQMLTERAASRRGGRRGSQREGQPTGRGEGLSQAWGRSGARGHRSTPHALCWFPGSSVRSATRNPLVCTCRRPLEQFSSSEVLTATRAAWLKFQPAASNRGALSPSLPTRKTADLRWQDCRGVNPEAAGLPCANALAPRAAAPRARRSAVPSPLPLPSPPRCFIWASSTTSIGWSPPAYLPSAPMPMPGPWPETGLRESTAVSSWGPAIPHPAPCSRGGGPLPCWLSKQSWLTCGLSTPTSPGSCPRHAA